MEVIGLEHQISLTPLLLVTVLSFLVPIMIKRIRRIYIPVVVGEIIVGMIIGKSGFDIIVMDESLKFIQFFGLAYLMFVAGLEIDFGIFSFKSKMATDREQTSSVFRHPLFLSFLILMITLSLAYGVSFMMMQYGLVKDSLLMSLILGTTSLGIVVPILKEKRISSTKYGQYIITGAVVADFVTMLLISVAVSLFQGGVNAEILLVFGLLLLVFILYRLSDKMRQTSFFQELTHGTTQIGIRGAFAVMLLFLVLSDKLGVEMILGAFLAGTVISLASKSKREDIHHKLDAIGFGFLIPTFFILVGVNFDISTLINNPRGLLLVPILFILVYIVKGIPALLLKLVFPWKKAVAGGLLLTSKLSLTIAAAAIGVQIGAISQEVSAAILLVSILTSLVSPILFGRMIPTIEENEEEKHVVIIGSTKRAIFLARRLVKLGLHVLLLESKRDKAEEMMTTGIEIVWGDATDRQLLEEIELNNAKAVVIATGNDDINFKISKLIVKLYPKRQVIVLLSDPSLIEKAYNYELIRVVNPQLSTVNLIENMVRHPVAASILEDKRDLHMEEVELLNPILIDIHLRNIRLPGDVLVLSVYKNGETILPHGDTRFERGDILLVMGTSKDVEEFTKMALKH